jgi:hypothetical protein
VATKNASFKDEHLLLFWQNPNLWKQYGGGNYYEERRQAVISILPPALNSVLDVGTGLGEIINELPSALRVVGLDISRMALQKVERSKTIGTIVSLPFPQNSFDLVMCLEVLEHLPEHAFKDAIMELQRISRSWLLIGVPYKENLFTRTSRCPACYSLFHADTHFRSFPSVRQISALFPDFELQTHLLVGPTARRKTRLGQWLNHKAGLFVPWENYFICPVCGNQDPPSQRNRSGVVGKFCQRLDELLSGLNQSLPYWFVGLLHRKQRE